VVVWRKRMGRSCGGVPVGRPLIRNDGILDLSKKKSDGILALWHIRFSSLKRWHIRPFPFIYLLFRVFDKVPFIPRGYVDPPYMTA